MTSSLSRIGHGYISTYTSSFRYECSPPSGTYTHCRTQDIVGTIPRATMPQQDPAAIAAFRNLKDRVQSELRKYRGGSGDPRPQRPAHSSDFARLARRICGKSIGIVLGGGGARGISHLVRLHPLCAYNHRLTCTRVSSVPWRSMVSRSIWSEVRDLCLYTLVCPDVRRH